MELLNRAWQIKLNRSDRIEAAQFGITYGAIFGTLFGRNALCLAPLFPLIAFGGRAFYSYLKRRTNQNNNEVQTKKVKTELLD